MIRARTWLFLATLAGLSSGVPPAQGEVSLDGSLGPAGSLPGPAYLVAPSAGTRAGSNLFFSFRSFSLSQGESATFSGPGGPEGVHRIVARVTGAEPSTIDGTLRNLIPGADFYLLNPSGIQFGPNARLDVRGSFYASTADSIRFSDGGQLATGIADTPSSLSVASPSAFGFLADTPRPITGSGTRLVIPERRTLALVGGDVLLDGTSGGIGLDIDDGRLDLVSVGGRGEVLQRAEGLVASATTPGGQLGLTGGVAIDARRLRADLPQGPAVRLSGRDVVLSDVSIDARAINQDRPIEAGSIEVAATDSIVITRSDVTASTQAAGDAGAIDIRAGSIELRDGSRLLADSEPAAAGAAGRIEMEAGRITLSGLDGSRSSGISAAVEGGAATRGSAVTGAGEIYLRGGLLELRDGAFVEASTDLDSKADAGRIDIRVGRLHLGGGSSISVSNRGEGDGGSLQVAAREEFSIRGSRSTGGTPSRIQASGIFANVVDRSSSVSEGTRAEIRIETPILELDELGRVAAISLGNAEGGNIFVVGDVLRIAGGAQITTSADAGGDAGNVRAVLRREIVLSGTSPDGPSALRSTGSGSGGAGRIDVDTGRLVIRDGAEISTQAGTRSLLGNVSTGDGGAIAVEAKSLVMDRGSILAASSGTGDAGEIAIRGARVIQLRDSRIATEAREAAGGNVRIEARELVDLLRSAITTNVNGGDGGGGDIFIDPDFVILDRSRITARAVRGDGGNIQIIAGIFLASPDSRVDASSSLGIDGTVRIEAADTNLSSDLAALPESILDVAVLLRDRCNSRRSDVSGSLSVSSMPGAPGPDPDRPLDGSVHDRIPVSLGDEATGKFTLSGLAVESAEDGSARGWILGCVRS